MTLQTYSLHDLTTHIRQVIALNFRTPVWITAEITESGLSKGHLYLSLAQKSEAATMQGDEGILAQAQAIVWQKDRRRIAMAHGQMVEMVLRPGVQARLQVRVDVHERYGLKLHIEDIDPEYSLGFLALQRQKTRETLLQEGLLHQNKSLPLPLVVQRIAVITSADAAGFHDFKAHIAQNPFGYAFQYRCFYTAVQGRYAESEICAALAQISDRHTEFDAVAIIRGGGSKLDLSAFDGLELGRAVGRMPLPVLSGIGHETDEAILDTVAHASFKTPTAVADFLIERALRFDSGLQDSAARITGLASQMVVQASEQVHFARHLAISSAQRLVAVASGHVEASAAEVPLLTRQWLKNEQRHLDQVAALIEAHAPETILKRGFTLTLKNGRAITSAADIRKGDRLTTRFADGDQESVVE